MITFPMLRRALGWFLLSLIYLAFFGLLVGSCVLAEGALEMTECLAHSMSETTWWVARPWLDILGVFLVVVVGVVGFLLFIDWFQEGVLKFCREFWPDGPGTTDQQRTGFLKEVFKKVPVKVFILVAAVIFAAILKGAFNIHLCQ